MSYDIRNPITNDIIVKGHKDYRIARGHYDFSKSLDLNKSEQYIVKLVTDYT